MRALYLIAGMCLILAPRTACGQLSVSELDRFASDAVSRGSIQLIPMTIGVEHNVVVKRGGSRFDAAEESSPLTILLNAEAERKTGLDLLKSTSDVKLADSLRTASAASKTLIEKMVEAIGDAHLDKDKRLEVLRGLSAQVSATYNDAVTTYATAIGKQPGFAAEKSLFSIAVSTDPDGGIVRYMLAGDYDLYLLAKQMNINTEAPRWITPVSPNEIHVAGFVWFSAEWTNLQKQHSELLHVTKDAAFGITPEGFSPGK